MDEEIVYQLCSLDSVEHNFCQYIELTAWSNVMLHCVEDVGVNLPIGDTELARAMGPVTVNMAILCAWLLPFTYTVNTWTFQNEVPNIQVSRNYFGTEAHWNQATPLLRTR